MSLISDIQQSIISGQSIAPTLLKLRLLAAKLDSKELESWIRHESEGYPNDVIVPNYRKIPMSFTANFSGSFGSEIKNAPIPNHLVEKIAGKNWVTLQFKKSISEMEDLISKIKDHVYTNASDLILLLQGKFYPDYTCISVSGTFPSSFLKDILNSVRNRILEFTIQLEKSIPAVSSIKFPQTNEQNNINKNKQVIQIINQTISEAVNTGDNIQISLIIKGDKPSLIKYLSSNKIPADDAKTLADIIVSEQSNNKEEPFGKKLKKWIGENLIKSSELWKIASSTLLKTLEKAISSYYGL